MDNQKDFVKREIASIVEKHPPKHSLKLNLGECVIEASTNSPELLDKLARYFGDFVTQRDKADIVVAAIETEPTTLGLSYEIKPPDPGKKKIKEEFINIEGIRLIRKRLTGMLFMMGEGQSVAIGPCLANDNQVINFINNRLIQYMLNKQGLLCHAAGVNIEGKGIAMAGFSGMGKSTLALHLMSKGLNYVSNDRLIIRRSNGKAMMHGVPKLPRINPGTALNNPNLGSILSPEDKKRFEDMDTEELWTLEHKYDVYIDKCFGPNKFVLSSDMNLVVLLNWQRNSAPTWVRKIEISERRDLLNAFMKETGLFYQPGSDTPPDFSEEAYIACIGSTPVLEISGGINFDAAVDKILEFVHKL